MKLSQSEIELLVDGAIESVKKIKPTLLPENLLKLKNIAVSIAWVESNFITTAANKHSTAKGLFQILDGTAKDIQDRILKYKIPNYNVFKPEHNALLGVAYLAYQSTRYNNDFDKAIIAYNQGSFRENKDSLAYYQKVDTTYSKFFSNYTYGYSTERETAREQSGTYNPLIKPIKTTSRRNYYVK